MVAIGKSVPDLRGDGTTGPIRLRDLRGQPVIVYFYPKDNTTGCTREAQDFRDLVKAFTRHKAIVLGVSRDSLASHEKFRAKQKLTFALVSDPDETWCRAFDVIHEKTLYGRKFMGVVRSTFLIGADGKLLREWRGVKVPGHAQAVLDAISAT
ncbi:MAG: peroxiredoxin [Proteobacteria bacterium]|nr:peroxiredoxin [Pseudomonadota bacterium]MCE7951057.1 peroxiredoxin [Xanthomonadales bacterium PRO7]